MSNTSIRPIPTLKGMFSVPRVTPGRNFLKENKKSLRSLEKTTSEKLAAKKPVRPKWMPPLRRTASEARDPKPKHCQSDRLSSSQADDEVCLLRTHNSSRSQNSLHKTQPGAALELSKGPAKPQNVEKGPPIESKSQPLVVSQLADQPANQQNRCKSCSKETSGTSIAIQTDDITDEIYLTNALKKCNVVSKTSLTEGSKLCADSGPEYDDNENYIQYNDDEQPLSARSYGQEKYGLLNIDDSEEAPLPEEEDFDCGQLDTEAPLSARSRDTIATEISNATTKTKRREHKLGSRDELRLPRYLEKEKREKAEARERANSRDPDCPRGHVLMSDPDRLAALATAKKRFENLINELNHMPMTAQTLRVRLRKAEIDKELAVVEDEIRIYSKPKVYVKIAKSRNL